MDWAASTAAGTGGTMTASPLATTAAPVVASGSPARRCFSDDCPRRSCSACAAETHLPSLVMPIGTTSYLSVGMASRTEAAESSETSCSPLRPPKRMPTRSLFMRRLSYIHFWRAFIHRGGRGDTEGPTLVRRVADRLQDFLAEGAERQLDREDGGAVVLVDDRVDFDDFEALHA